MTKKKLVRALWRLIREHQRGPYCKTDCALRGELRGLVKRVTQEGTKS